MSDAKHCLLEIGSWTPKNETFPAGRTSIDLGDNDVKPPQTKDTHLGHPSRSFDGSFESDDGYQQGGHWSMNEAKWEIAGWRAGNETDNECAEAELARIVESGKLGGAKTFTGIKGGTYRQPGAVQEPIGVQLLLSGGPRPATKEKSGEILLRWLMQSSEDPWHLGSGE